MVRVSKKKQEATLKRMQTQRKKDYIFLRDIVIDKLKWAEKEKKIGEQTLKEYAIKTRSVNQQMLRLEGIILAFKELLEQTPEDK